MGKRETEKGKFFVAFHIPPPLYVSDVEDNVKLISFYSFFFLLSSAYNKTNRWVILLYFSYFF